MSSARYERLPTTPTNDEEHDHGRAPPAPAPPHDPRFDQPTPAVWKRVALLVFIAFMFWLSFAIRNPYQKSAKPKVVHAHRYSKEHKFRPAASPIITERLKDGRVRVRGAQPTYHF